MMQALFCARCVLHTNTHKGLYSCVHTDEPANRDTRTLPHSESIPREWLESPCDIFSLKQKEVCQLNTFLSLGASSVAGEHIAKKKDLKKAAQMPFLGAPKKLTQELVEALKIFQSATKPPLHPQPGFAHRLLKPEALVTKTRRRIESLLLSWTYP